MAPRLPSPRPGDKGFWLMSAPLAGEVTHTWRKAAAPLPCAPPMSPCQVCDPHTQPVVGSTQSDSTKMKMVQLPLQGLATWRGGCEITSIPHWSGMRRGRLGWGWGGRPWTSCQAGWPKWSQSPRIFQQPRWPIRTCRHCSLGIYFLSTLERERHTHTHPQHARLSQGLSPLMQSSWAAAGERQREVLAQIQCQPEKHTTYRLRVVLFGGLSKDTAS